MTAFCRAEVVNIRNMSSVDSWGKLDCNLEYRKVSGMHGPSSFEYTLNYISISKDKMHLLHEHLVSRSYDKGTIIYESQFYGGST